MDGYKKLFIAAVAMAAIVIPSYSGHPLDIYAVIGVVGIALGQNVSQAIVDVSKFLNPAKQVPPVEVKPQ